ncbi:MAG: signal peptidase II [Lachnospiraceae bacterium]|nr:signal peptidase II [Lachnospiraceae bacterium]
MNIRKEHIKSYLFGLIMTAVCIFIDQWTKLLVVDKIKGNDGLILIKGVFQLHYLENRGAAFGIMQNQKIYFVICGVLISVLVGFIYGKIPISKRYSPLRICSVLIVSGALGNMIDRIRLGYVVDFFYFELINFPIFNMADIYVVIATSLLVLLLLFYYKEEELSFLTLKKKV